MSLTRNSNGRKDAQKWKEIVSAYKILTRKCKGQDHLGEHVVNGRIILKCILTDIHVRMMEWILLPQNHIC
jgi:hypothetical protein